MSQSRISKIVNGSEPISLVQAFTAAKFLDVDVDWLLDVEDIRRNISDGEFQTLARSSPRDFFYEIIKYALGKTSPSVSPSQVSPGTSVCERILSAYTTEDLVRELEARGWKINLTR